MGRMGRSTRVVVSVCLLAILLTVFEPRPAGADPFGTGTTNTGFLADNHDHDWCWSTNWPSSWTTDATNRHINLENQTLFSGGSNESCGSGTDVYWKASATSDPVYFGHFECNLRRIADDPNLSGYIRPTR